MWDDPLQITLFALSLFVALTAIGGGIAILAGLERGNFPQEWLEGTPFESYTIPGVLLAVLVGGSSSAAAVTLPLSSGAGTVLSMIAGAVLTGWIIGEIRILNTPGVSKTEVVYLVLGVALIAIGAASLATS